MCLCNLHQLLLQMCMVFFILKFFYNCVFSDFIVSFIVVNSTKSCQFGLIEKNSLLYNRVWQSSYQAFITMLGRT